VLLLFAPLFKKTMASGKRRRAAHSIKLEWGLPYEVLATSFEH